jgi:hypothetical protein
MSIEIIFTNIFNINYIVFSPKIICFTKVTKVTYHDLGGKSDIAKFFVTQKGVILYNLIDLHLYSLFRKNRK